MNDDLRELVAAAEAVLYGTEDGGEIPGELRSRLNFALLPFDEPGARSPEPGPGEFRPYIDLFGVAAISRGGGTAWEYGRPGLRMRKKRPALRIDNIAYTGRARWASAGARRLLRDSYLERVVGPESERALNACARLAAAVAGDFYGWLPKFILVAREARGWSQKDLAERADVDKGTISRWERGVVWPSSDSLVRVLFALAD